MVCCLLGSRNVIRGARPGDQGPAAARRPDPFEMPDDLQVFQQKILQCDVYTSIDTHMQLDPRQFQVHPSSGVPIYRQVMEQVKSLIAAGTLKAGDMLPSVRELSGVLQVNMMTISRAWSKLQDERVVEHVRGRGVRVLSRQPQPSLKNRREDIAQLAEPVVLRAVQLGLTDDQIVAVVKQLLREQHR